jgi:hypothetical protein
MFIQYGFDSLGPADIVGDELVDAKQPGYREQAGKGPEREPLQDLNHSNGKVCNDLWG